ncbi:MULTISPECIES: mandelate racemase/muconate lactonizing enzyme family protein [unclassified Ruegeria]|uniref:mandelate racemase/muconate lactonizing enzyme family protein n=1 Tax=unclassified Ruegeria TaxID=2625375 RepID=UPI00148994C0|nr:MULTISPECIES: mandelate racemase/muconate lactonizing enzyme family protein [unclassified Ruegeria]NOD77792.1 mandelate racemase [Ruegeria sp. HKCCD4332]
MIQPAPIVSARAWQQYQPFAAGKYVCRGQTEHGFHAVIVAIEAADGTIGWGEAAPLGAFYAEAFPEEMAEGTARLLPEVIGRPSDAPAQLAEVLNAAMLGQPGVKSAIDMAAWDLAARRAGMPLCSFLGGGATRSVTLYRSISQAAPDEMAQSAQSYLKQGYRRLQVKVGQDPLEDIERLRAVRSAVPSDVALYADANGGWLVEDALRFLRGVGDLDFWLEQPCMSMAENRRVAQSCPHPFILDESITGLEPMLVAHADGMVSGVTLKMARIGGVGPTRLLSDVAVQLGLKVTIEDTGGSTINTAATAQMMARLPVRLAAHTVDFMNWVTVQNATGMPPCTDGLLHVPKGAGLGVEVDPDTLGEPFSFSA